MQTTIKADIFQAAFISAGKDDIRYYLNGIHLNGTRIAATDGHRLFVGNADGDIVGVTIPHTLIKAALPAIKKSETVVVEPYHDEYALLVGPNRYVFKPIGGDYPDYTRIVPNSIEESPAQFNPKYINDIGKQAKILTKDDCGFHIFQSNNNPSGVKFKGRDDCFGVIMPRRPYEGMSW